MEPMRIRSYRWIAAAVCVHLGFAMTAHAQFGRLRDLKKVVEGVKENVDDKPQSEAPAQTAEEEQAGQTKGRIVFSASPIDPAKPDKLVNEFKAGTHIYGLIQIERTWRELLAKGRDDATKVQVPIDLLVDGKNTEFQYITITKPEAIDSKMLVLDIAPEPGKMKAYKEAGFLYAEGKGNRKIGPDTYTYNLSKLTPGKHTVRFQVRSFGDIYSAGEFTIEGQDYSFYDKLRDEVLKEAFAVATMPQAQKVDKELEATMRKLLENAGWNDIRKLVITDKDWWLDRVSGGDSPIKSRHIAAAVAAKADDGSFFWSVCTFHQQKLIDGSFGPLELTHVGDKKPILEENIDK